MGARLGLYVHRQLGIFRMSAHQSSEADMGTSHFFRFDSTQSQKVLIPTQLMTYDGFQELVQINSRLEMFFLI